MRAGRIARTPCNARPAPIAEIAPDALDDPQRGPPSAPEHRSRYSRTIRQTAPVLGNAIATGPAPPGAATMAPTSTT